MEDDRRDGVVTGLGRREQGVEVVDVPPEPEEARDEHELELAHDRPFEPHEQVVEPSVLEVVLDPRPADPAGAPVDDDDLAVVDVPDGAEVPPVGGARAEGA